MTLYFCIADLLDDLEKIEDPQARKNHLAAVTTEKPSCDGHADDAFSLSSTPILLNLNKSDAHYQMAGLLENVPLYQINLQMILDEILAERHKNISVMKALFPVFEGGRIPETVDIPKENKGHVTGHLRHPALSHFDRSELCRIYISFLNGLSHNRELYDFEKNIIGKQPEQFLKYMDGFVSGQKGKIKASILIGFGIRLDHKPYDSTRPMEHYVREGKTAASEMQISEPQEFLWAWLEAQDFQIRRCREIHRLFTLENYNRVPNWVRSDLLQLIAKEAMKQFFAKKIVQCEKEGKFVLKDMPEIRKSIEYNEKGELHPVLHQLISETLRPDFHYSGAAGKFVDTAKRSICEAKSVRIF